MKAVEWAQEHIIRDTDRVILVSVRDDKPILNANLPKTQFEIAIAEYKKEDEKREEALLAFKKLLPGRYFEIKILHGDLKTELVKYVEELGPLVLIVGSRGLSGFKKIFVGSTSEYLVQHLKIPVLVSHL